MNIERSLSGFQLKIIALVCMTLDHVWFFIPNMPLTFHWVGRLSAPIFIYCCTIGFVNTGNKKNYFLRIYVLSLIMGVFNYFTGHNINFIRTLLVIIPCVFIAEKIQSKDKRALLYALLFVLWQLTVFALVFVLLFKTDVAQELTLLVLTVLSGILYLNGGILFVVIGICMFLFRSDQKKLLISLILITIAYVLFYNTHMIPFIIAKVASGGLELPLVNAIRMIFEIHPMFMETNPLYGNPQWMMVFSLIFILKYNGSRGIGLKYFFYLFYPAHIATLYVLSQL